MIFGKKIEVEDGIFITANDICYYPNEENATEVRIDCTVKIPKHGYESTGVYRILYPAMNTFAIIVSDRYIIINKLMGSK